MTEYHGTDIRVELDNNRQGTGALEPPDQRTAWTNFSTANISKAVLATPVERMSSWRGKNPASDSKSLSGTR